MSGESQGIEGITFREVDERCWGDMEKLFEGKGGSKHCWCMVWRRPPGSLPDGASKKAAMKRIVEQGVPVGILGYVKGEPAAWCSIAPRATYRDLGGWNDPEHPDENVWSIVCFYITRKYRRQGLMKLLLQAAVDHAREQGATAVEAYPVAPDSPSYRFMGFVPLFESFGFVEVGRAGSRRHVMRLKLGKTT